MIKWLKKYNLSRGQIIGLILFIAIGLLHNLIASDRYIIGKSVDGIGFFIEKSSSTNGISALIPYNYRTIDRNNRSVSPFGRQSVDTVWKRHWLGTDALGRDVLAGIIHGFFVALLVGFLTTLIAFIIGGALGILSGYYGDDKIRISRRDIIVLLALGFFTIFYFIYRESLLKWVSLFCLLIYFAKIFSNKQIKNGIAFPLDLIIFRIIEILKAIPGIFLILVLLAMFKQPHVLNVIFVLVLLRWSTITRLLRAEVLSIRDEKFVLAAKAGGLPDRIIIKDYILPQVIPPIFVASAFGFAAAILTESTLSFLGIGLPAESVTWGSMLNDAKDNIKLWWLALFPGLMIYLVLRLFNSMGDRLSDYLKGEKAS